MSRHKKFLYPMWIYINNQRNKIELQMEVKDGHWTAIFADLKAMGSYSGAILGIRDQVHAIIQQEMEQRARVTEEAIIHA